MSTRDVLQEVAALLEANHKDGRPIERHQAGALAHVLRRLLDDSGVQAAVDAHDGDGVPDARVDQFFCALAYVMLFELGGPGTSWKAREDVRRFWPQFSMTSIPTLVSKWRPAVDAWLKRMERNCANSSLTRHDQLRRELADIIPAP